MARDREHKLWSCLMIELYLNTYLAVQTKSSRTQIGATFSAYIGVNSGHDTCGEASNLLGFRKQGREGR